MGLGGEGYAPATLPQEKGPGTHCTEGWGGGQGRVGLARKT